MLFKILGFLTSFANVAILYALYSNRIIIDLGSPYWSFGIASILFLSFVSTIFFYMYSDKHGKNAMKFYGVLYAALAILIYGFWSIRNLFYKVSMNELSGFLMVFLTLATISFLAIYNYRKEGNQKILFHLSSSLSVLTLGITFATIYKYIFLQAPFEFDNLLIEMFIIFIGSLFFISTFYFSRK